MNNEVCPECSALVADLPKHGKWHRAERRRPPAIGKEREMLTQKLDGSDRIVYIDLVDSNGETIGTYDRRTDVED